MFGNSIFRNDPFFQNPDLVSEFDRMDQMMTNFHGSFGLPMSPMLPPPSMYNERGRMKGYRPQQGMVPLGGSMFGDMFGNMDAMISQMQNNPNAHSFSSSSSKVVSYSNDGTGQPKYYETSSETTQGPGGVRQTRKSERNSVTGMDRMAIGHHIYDRGHVVERSRNRRTNEREENHDFLNIDEEEKDAFHQEWQHKTRPSSRATIGHDASPPTHRPQRAINSAEYHRSNLERPRARHRDRDRDRHIDGRRVQINSQPEEI